MPTVHEAHAISLGMTGDELHAAQLRIADGEEPWDERYWTHGFFAARKSEFIREHPTLCYRNIDGTVTDQVLDYPAWFNFIYKRAREIAARRSPIP